MEETGRDIGKAAESYFTSGYNCAESVTKALCDTFGLDWESAAKIATPFGGGIVGKGYLCGAVTGAMIALGLCKVV